MFLDLERGLHGAAFAFDDFLWRRAGAPFYLVAIRVRHEHKVQRRAVCVTGRVENTVNGQVLANHLLPGHADMRAWRALLALGDLSEVARMHRNDRSRKSQLLALQ